MNPTPQFDPKQLQQQFESQFTRIIQIGEFRFGETDKPPSFPGATTPPAGAPLPPPIQFVRSVERLTLAQARERFDFQLPAWVPEGFEFKDEITVPGPPEQLPEGLVLSSDIKIPVSLSFHWGKAETDHWLALTQNEPSQSSELAFMGPVPPNGVKAVSVHQQPAALVRQQWGQRHDLQKGTFEDCILNFPELLWAQGQWQYSLRASENTLTEADFVRVAESVA